MNFEGIEIRHLRYFVAVANELHFGRAAKQVGIAQPPLSQQIQRLETLLGHDLFVRRPTLSLTPVGKALYGHAVRLISQFEEGISYAREVASGREGELRVGYPASVLATSIPKVFREYRRAYPNAVLRLRELSSGAQTEQILKGELDLGIIREPGEIRSLSIVTLVEEPFIVALPPESKLAAQKRIRLKSLTDEHFVDFPRELAPGLHDRITELCMGVGFKPQVVQEAKEWLTILGLVEAGAGVALVPASFRSIHWGETQYRDLDLSNVMTRICLCHRKAELIPTAKAFADLALSVTGRERAKAKRQAVFSE